MTAEIEHGGILRGSRQQIIDVARELFSERTYLGVSMSDIAKRLGMTKAALYYHFTGKSELYLDVLHEVFAELRGRLDKALIAETHAQQLLNMVTSYLKFGVEEHNLLNVLATKLSPSDKELREFVAVFRSEIDGLFRPVISAVFGTDEDRSGVDARLVTTMLTAMMDGLVLEHSFFQSDLDPSGVATQIVAILGLDREPHAYA